MELSNCNYVIWTNRVRCRIKSLIYSTRKAFLEKAVVELVYKFDKKSYEKVSRSLKYESNYLFFIHKHIYVDTNTDQFTLHACASR